MVIIIKCTVDVVICVGHLMTIKILSLSLISLFLPHSIDQPFHLPRLPLSLLSHPEIRIFLYLSIPFHPSTRPSPSPNFHSIPWCFFVLLYTDAINVSTRPPPDKGASCSLPLIPGAPSTSCANTVRLKNSKSVKQRSSSGGHNKKPSGNSSTTIVSHTHSIHGLEIVEAIAWYTCITI